MNKKKKYWRDQTKTTGYFSIRTCEQFSPLLDMKFTFKGKETVLTFSKLNLYDTV